MKGQILDFSVQENKGVISGGDGKRYHFEGKEWKESGYCTRGLAVDFDLDENGNAVGVYQALKGNNNSVSFQNFQNLGSGKPKNKVVAALLAFFLGGFGIHKFYLGTPIPGIVYLMASLFSFVLAAVADEGFIFINFIICLLAFIDMIIYLTKSDEDFQRIYVEEKRQWF